MKSKFVFPAIALLLCMLPLSAMGQVQYGIQLSYDVSFPMSSNNPYKTGSGFTLGGVAEISLPKRFFVEPGVMFTFRSMPSKNLVSFDDEYFYEGAGKIYTIHVPVRFGYRFYENELWSVAVSTGPYLNVNVAAQQKLEPNFGAPERVPDKKISLFDHGWKHVDGGWNIRLSTTFAGSYFVGIDGDVSFTPLAEFGNRDKKIRIHRSSVSVVLGYYF